MNDLETRLQEMLDYYCSMQIKYILLNDKAKNKYLWRVRAIQERIETLQELKSDSSINSFDECYEEDLRESEEH